MTLASTANARSTLEELAARAVTVVVELVIACTVLAWTAWWLLVAQVNLEYGDYAAITATVGLNVLPALGFEYRRLESDVDLPDWTGRTSHSGTSCCRAQADARDSARRRVRDLFAMSVSEWRSRRSRRHHR